MEFCSPAKRLFLLEAFRQVQAALPAAKLTIIGEGPFREPMLQMVRAMKIADHTHFVGEIPHNMVHQHLRSAAVFLQHSVTADDGDEEGLPVSILEAMAEGLPVVSTRHAGIPEAVEDGHAGFIVGPGDCEQMAVKTVQLLLDPPLRVRMGASGQQTVNDRYSIESALNRLRTVLLKHWPEERKGLSEGEGNMDSHEMSVAGSRTQT